MEKEALKQLFDTSIEYSGLRPELIKKLQEHYITNIGNLVYFEAESDLYNKDFLTSNDVCEIKECLANIGFSTYSDSVKAINTVKAIDDFKDLKERVLSYDCEATQTTKVMVVCGDDLTERVVKDMRLNFATGTFEIII